MKKLIPFCLPVGMFGLLIYRIAERYFRMTDVVAIPYLLIVCVILIIGIAYQSKRFYEQRTFHHDNNGR